MTLWIYRSNRKLGTKPGDEFTMWALRDHGGTNYTEAEQETICTKPNQSKLKIMCTRF